MKRKGSLLEHQVLIPHPSSSRPNDCTSRLPEQGRGKRKPVFDGIRSHRMYRVASNRILSHGSRSTETGYPGTTQWWKVVSRMALLKSVRQETSLAE